MTFKIKRPKQLGIIFSNIPVGRLFVHRDDVWNDKVYLYLKVDEKTAMCFPSGERFKHPDFFSGPNAFYVLVEFEENQELFLRIK